MKKKLITIIVVLIPIYIISFPKKTNFIMPENITEEKEIIIKYENQEMLLDDYVYHVVATEVPASFYDEAIKAQILATRTYTYNKVYNNKDYVFTIGDQAFKSDEELKTEWQNNYNEYSSKIKKLILDTEGKIITYNNEPIKSYYFSMSNGYTANVVSVFKSDEEYLQSVESDYERELPNYKVTKEISLDDFATKLSLELPINISNIKRDETNRVESITINGNIFDGLTIRKKLNLRSTDFTIKIKENNIEITTTGYGHGVGLSQYGANIMASQGFNYEDIIKKYYTNVEITNLSV